jgi:tRNA-specific 2-thiouridylase
VARKDLARNALIVVQGHDHPLMLSKTVATGSAHWLIDTPSQPFEAGVKLRYRQSDQHCRVSLREHGRLQIECHDPQRAVTPGQFAVLYSDTRCLGGAVIESAAP